MDAFKKIVKSKNIPLTEINVTGTNKLVKIMSAIYISDWVSYYLAIRYGQDPTPIYLIEQLKNELKWLKAVS